MMWTLNPWILSSHVKQSEPQMGIKETMNAEDTDRSDHGDPSRHSDWSAAIQAKIYYNHPSSFNKGAVVVIAVCEESIIHADIQ